MHDIAFRGRMVAITGLTKPEVNSLKFESKNWKTDWRTKKGSWVIDEKPLYLKLIPSGDTFGVVTTDSWLPYFMSLPQFSDIYEKMKSYSLAEPLVIEDLNLWDSQIDTIRELTSRSSGICTLATGMGKTTMQATMVYYISHVLNEKVLVCTPDAKSLDELRLRYKTLFDIDCDQVIHTDRNENFININGYTRRNEYKMFKDHQYFKEIKWIIADECEYVVSDGGIELLNLCTNALRRYAFSGTSNKYTGGELSVNTDIDMLGKNFKLISQFGFNVIFQVPMGWNIEVTTYALDSFPAVDTNQVDISRMYHTYMEYVWTNSAVMRDLGKIVHKYKGIYIPMERREILETWLTSCMNLPDKTYVLISSSGYQIWKQGEVVDTVSLDVLKNMISNNEVDVILSTRSGFRALDFPCLDTVLPLTSNMASALVQAIGRCARSKNIKVIHLTSSVWIPLVSKKSKDRLDIIKNYYSQCNITIHGDGISSGSGDDLVTENGLFVFEYAGRKYVQSNDSGEYMINILPKQIAMQFSSKYWCMRFIAR